MSSSKESEDEKLKRVASTSDGVEGVEDLPLPSSSAVRLVLKPWRVRFWDQLTILIYKQTLVYARNLRSTLLRLLAPFFFMFLLWLLNLAVQANSVAYDALVNVPAPSVETVASIPDCSTDTFIKGFPCYDFIYSPNNSKTVGTVVDGMRNNNPGRVIPSSAVLGFASIEDANSWLLGNPESVIGGVHFLLNEPAAGSTLNYVLQVNSTTKYFKNRYQDPTFYAALPLQAAAERELARMATNGILKSWNASVSQFAHPTVGDLNIVGKTLGPFIFAANMFNFVLLLASVVSEREQGLRQALTTSGMLDSAFWMSWLIVEATISVLFSLLIIAFGAAFGFAFFLQNSFAIIFLLFLLFQWAMVGLAFIVSAFISQTTTAINLGFVIFIIGWIVQAAVDFNFPYSPNYYSSIPVLTAIFTLLPFATLTKASVDLGAATTSTAGGIPWSRRNAYCQNIQSPAAQDAMFATDPEAYWNFNCVFPIGNILAILAIEAFVYALLAVYLDNVFAASNGVRKPLWYFLSPQYWSGSSTTRRSKGKSSILVKTPLGYREIKATKELPNTGGEEAHLESSILVKTPLGYREIKATKELPNTGGEEAHLESTDPDVMAEEAAMRQLLLDRSENGSTGLQADIMNAVELYGLQKQFRIRTAWWPSIVAFFSCCFPTRRKASNLKNSNADNKKNSSSSSSSNNNNKMFWAIKGSWFSIKRDRLFCLLGPNGAGKTTTINCLTGVLPPSGGGALVYGESITAPGGLDRIRAVMGVCPQFDVLWPELTAEEHMYIYGRVKGLSRSHVTKQTQELLESVKLVGAASQRSGTFSGGMKRRLSVAVALLGDPLLVFLDEPTTGMDPISRRHVWDAIEDAKHGRAIVLTTHSMEEADILGDEIGIMARGKLRAYGTSLRLKQRFGSGYQLAIAVEDDSHQAEIRRMFEEELGVKSPDPNDPGHGRYSIFHVPKEKESILSDFLKRIEAKKTELGITDIQISLTSLEEVFLNIAKQAEIEAAAAEGRNTVTINLEDGGVIEVSMGEESAVREDTGDRYSITWAQDEEGKLQVSSWRLLEAAANDS